MNLPDVKLPWVVVDTETSGTHPDDGARVACVAISYQWRGGLEIQSFPFDQGVRDKFPNPQLSLSLFGAEADPNLGQNAWNALLWWLLNQRLAFHNGKYDLMMLRAGTRHWEGIDLMDAFWWDTMITQRVLDPTHDVGLDTTLRRLGLGSKIGHEGMKEWLKRHKYPVHRYDLVPWDIARPYVEGDVEGTANLLMQQLDRLEAPDAVAA